MPRPVRATRAEQEASLPGDALIPRAVGAATNAITIGGPPREVWPWLVRKQLLGITARVERTRRRATAVAEEAS